MMPPCFVQAHPRLKVQLARLRRLFRSESPFQPTCGQRLSRIQKTACHAFSPAHKKGRINRRGEEILGTRPDIRFLGGTGPAACATRRLAGRNEAGARSQ